MKCNTVYLNDFRKEKVLEVVESLKHTKGIIIKDLTEIKGDYLLLSYSPMFHRLDIHNFNIDEPIFCNPRCECRMASRDVFVSSIMPNEKFHQLMNAK